MLLIFSESSSTRLQYICQYLFAERMQIEFQITHNKDEFNTYDGPAICYAQEVLNSRVLHMGCTRLLFENDIRHQPLNLLMWQELPAFFEVAGANLPFDLFSAAFYLLSRYEEYLPYTDDFYGRYPHSASLAYKGGFLEQPLIDQWMMKLADLLQQRFPLFSQQLPAFKVLPTYDIDIAWSYLHKGWWRNTGAWLKSPSFERLAVLAGQRCDPFDVYDWLDDCHAQAGIRPRYFFLLAEKNNRYDKNISPTHPAMQQLVQQHARKYDVGIHPGWESGNSDALLRREISRLASLTGERVQHSRQHYIRFKLPDGYRRLIAVGITNDYSMGYGSINGFRASVAAPFNWFDLERNTITALKVHPFCFMDANAYYEEKLNAESALTEMMAYQQRCEAVKGTMITIWHNNFLGPDGRFKGWRAAYEKWISQLPPNVFGAD